MNLVNFENIAGFGRLGKRQHNITYYNITSCYVINM